MSVWRIDKVDAQTRSLAEAAAKAAGLPLGVWLERAILRRVEGRTPPVSPLPPIADEPGPAQPEERIEISAEMQAALSAAEQRRRKRGGGRKEAKIEPVLASAQPAPTAAANPIVEPDLVDPFAAPEKINDDSPFEQTSAFTKAADDVADPPALKLDEDEPIALSADDTAPGTDDALADAGDLPPLAMETQSSADATDDQPEPRAGYVPTWEGTAPKVTTTPRETLIALAGDGPAPRRAPLSGLAIVLAGFFVAVLAAGAAYFLLVEDEKPSDPTVAAAPPVIAEPAKPAEPPAVTATPAPAVEPAPQPSPPPVQSAAPTPTPDPPRAVGPSVLNLALGDSQSPQAVVQPAPQAAPTTAPAIPAAPPPATATKPADIANEALPTLRQRAEAGSLEAQVELGRRYIQGVGVGRNEVEAGKWLLRAAEQGDAQAQFNVGVMYERGVGLEANLPKAIEFYRKSAAQSTPMALHNLGLLFAAGAPGLKADPAQARKMMTQAAELGQLESQYSLALMHFQGVGGPVDRVASLSWLLIAARPNQPQIIENAKQLAAQLPPADRQRAEKAAEGHLTRIRSNLTKLQAGVQPASVAPTAPAAPRVIDRVAIAEMQKLLTSLKIYNGAADGAMGPRTAAAIREFQAMAGLPVDGKPSIEVWDSLREVAGLTNQ